MAEQQKEKPIGFGLLLSAIFFYLRNWSYL